MAFYNSENSACSWTGFFPTVCFVKGCMWDACAASLGGQQTWLPRGDHGSKASLSEGCSAKPGICSPYLGGRPWEQKIALPEGKKALIPQQNATAVLVALGVATVGEQYLRPVCQLWAPEIFPLADCGNASELSSAWIISEMLGNFLMPALVLVAAMLSVALEINIIVGCLFVFISKVSEYVSSAKA